MKKSSALALALAGTMAAPAVMAESGFYMSARLGAELETSDDATAEALTFGNKSTRLGYRMETDLGNGMTAYGKLEVTSSFGTRDLFVGMKGDFGDFKIAEKGYAAFYNHVSGPVDQPYWIGGSGILANYRTENHISYQGGTDAFSFEVTLEANGSDTSDTDGNTSLSGTQVGASIGLGDWTLGVAMRDAEDSTFEATNGSVTGVTISGNLGDISLAASFQSDDDQDGIQIHAGFGPFFVNYGQVDDDPSDSTPNEIGVGYARSIGRNTTFWAEASASDADDTGPDEETIIAVIRYDWN